jgi:hypothetical protein
MITKNDWNAALDSWIDEERERLGGPPSPEDVVAYLNGELPAAQAARVRALLVYYPELTPLLAERVEKPRVVRMPAVSALRVYAVAATAAVVLLAVNTIDERRRSGQPAVVSSRHEFNPNVTRSGAAGVPRLVAGQQRYIITLVPTAAPKEGSYTLELTRGEDILWREEGIQPIDETFVLHIPGERLEPGKYTLNVGAADGGVIDRYPFEVTVAR